MNEELDLLGGAPNHWEQKVVNKSKHSALNQHRSLHYSQSMEQRARLIASACDRLPLPHGLSAHAAKSAKKRYWRSIYARRQHAEFVTWFRSEFPEAYAIFTMNVEMLSCCAA